MDNLEETAAAASAFATGGGRGGTAAPAVNGVFIHLHSKKRPLLSRGSRRTSSLPIDPNCWTARKRRNNL